jgi:hypothetical protein
VTAPETQDARAERLLAVGIDVAVRIRDEDPVDVARTLDRLDRAELRDLAVLLAACVDIARPVSTLLAWWGQPPAPPPPDPPEPEPDPTPARTSTRARADEADIDPVRVNEDLAGRLTAADLNTAERCAAVTRLTTAGHSDREIAAQLGWPGGHAGRDAVLHFRRYWQIPAGGRSGRRAA